MIDRLKKSISTEVDKSVKKYFDKSVKKYFEETSKKNQDRLEDLLKSFHKDLKTIVAAEVEKQLNEQRKN